jgi:hypothetical protein
MKQQSAPSTAARQSDESKGLFPHSYPPRERAGRLGEGRSEAYGKLILISALCLCAGISAHATVTLVSVQSPGLSANRTSPVNSPVHFEATAESDLHVTGYVVYVDDKNVYQTMGSVLDAWVILPPDTTHFVYVRAWDASGSYLASPTYRIRVTGLVPPNPPAGAARITNLMAPSLDATSSWTVDNKSHVGGQCNHGSIGTFSNSFDPNTRNAPDLEDFGQHWLVASECQYDDSLFYWKHAPSAFQESTNFLWDLWFYIPTTTAAATVQAIEFDLFHAVRFDDGVREFMFGSQCHYRSNQWQLWLPKNGVLAWVNTGLSPCQFSTGAWHHMTYFLQRVTASGYQKGRGSAQSPGDTNTHLRFGTLTLDGTTMYLGAVSNSTIPYPAWSPVLGVQHQLDTAAAGVTIEQYVSRETVTAW